MKKNLITALFAVLVVASFIVYNQVTLPNDEFELWKNTYPTEWSVEEDPYRRIVFFKNLEKINQHNADPYQPYKMAINQFTSYTEAEFKLIFLSPKPYDPEWEKVDLQMPPNVTPIDWTQKGVISPVKSQGKCNSDYAFSATGALESFALMKNKTVDLSEQQIVDCSLAYENQGCKIGENFQALHYVKDHGLSSEDEYPYVAKAQTCKLKGGSFKITGVNYASGCTHILTALESRPIGISVDASNWASYKSGILHTCNSTVNLDALLVGASDEFWKIKNSWGPGWGQDGFIRIKSGNTCGICMFKSPWPV